MLFLFTLLLAIVVELATTAAVLSSPSPLSFEARLSGIAAKINGDAKSTWVATQVSQTPFAAMDVDEFKAHMLGTQLNPRNVSRPSKPPPVPAFDLRTAYPGCPSIAHIRDQGACGSCFAVATVTAFNDRDCIANGTRTALLSAQDITSCDHTCNAIGCDSGCKGGFPGNAYKYLIKTGVPADACDAYKLPPCHHPCGANSTTPACPAHCDDGSKKTMIKAKSSYPYFHADDLFTDLMTQGSITCGLSVYEDFPTYTSGVYQHTSGSMLGGHAVRLIGWGTDSNGVDYWTVANSWNTWWGENGFFRIIRGDTSKSAGFEEDCWAGCSIDSKNCGMH